MGRFFESGDVCVYASGAEMMDGRWGHEKKHIGKSTANNTNSGRERKCESGTGKLLEELRAITTETTQSKSRQPVSSELSV